MLPSYFYLSKRGFYIRHHNGLVEKMCMNTQLEGVSFSYYFLRSGYLYKKMMCGCTQKIERKNIQLDEEKQIVTDFLRREMYISSYEEDLDRTTETFKICYNILKQIKPGSDHEINQMSFELILFLSKEVIVNINM